jgi:hypothetical protein
MSLPGRWFLFYDWNSKGTYGVTAVTFAANNTWSCPGYTGKWFQGSGMLILQFDNHKTIYAGNIADEAAVGIMTDGLAGQGSFYMLQSVIMAQTVSAERHHPDGDVKAPS